TYNVKDNAVVQVDGRDGPANESRLCVKGRYGFDYGRHPNRLTKPLIRRDDAPPKSGDLVLDPANPLEAFREASWEEALDLAGGELKRIRDQHGPKSLVALGCAKGSNEEAYLVQKLVRTGFGSNNIDHCTRLCHAGSVVALGHCIGSGAVTLPVRDVMHADCVFLIGSNPTINHPVAATWIKNAIDQNGLKLVIADPRLQQLSRRAFMHLRFQPDSDVALLNGMIHTIIGEGLTNEAFIRDHTEGFEELKRHIQAYSPEAMAPICGIPAEELKQAARTYATSKNAMIIWGMGCSQSQHGSDNVRCLIALAMLTGQVGRRGAGLHPICGQNNVQGASDVGLMPNNYPDYQKVDNPEVQTRFEKLWGCKLSAEKGLTSMEMMDAANEGRAKGMYIMGENPAMSDANAAHARAGLANLEHLVVQDIFLTETAYNADVILPATVYLEKTGTFTNTDRWVQLGRQALQPPGEVRQDLWIVQELARRMGLDWNYGGPEEVFNELRKASD
ncbi:MAG: molybdopterin-dependent oxidoreductase, partial [Sinobacteraceae bacterium]|nr:molybdopterin-dependent oxidoreductase [Nevskiaceae bacterium]